MADELAVRALVEQYFAAYERKDLDDMMALWSSSSPDLTERKKQIQDFFTSTDGIVVAHVEFEKPLIEGEKARLLATLDLREMDAETAKPRDGLGKMIRSLEFVKDAGIWRILRDSDAVEALATLVATAKSAEAREILLARDKTLVSPALVQALDRNVGALYARGQYEQALDLVKTAHAMAMAISDQQGVARELLGMGQVYEAMGKHSEALEAYQQGLSIAEAMGDKRSVGRAMGQMSRVHAFQGNYSLAVEESQKSLQAFESVGNKRDIAIGLLSVGQVYVMEHDKTQPFGYLSRSLALAEELNDQDLINRLLLNLGIFFYQSGNRARALEYNQRSLAISRTTEALGLQAQALLDIGSIYFDQNDFAEALNYFQQSLDLGQKIAGKLVVANATQDSADVYRVQGDPDKALEYYRKALTLKEEMGVERSTISTLVSLGDLYASLQEYDQAFTYFDKSLRLGQKFGDQANIASVLAGMANARYMQKDFADALDLADRASVVAQKIDDRFVLWRCRWIAGQVLEALHRPDEARVALEEAITAVESLREDSAGGAEQRQSFFADKLAPYRGMVDLLATQSRVAEALSYAERAKGRTLLDALGNGRLDITKAMTAAEREREEGFQAQLVSFNRQVAVEKAAPKPDEGRLANLKSGLEKTRLQYSDFQTNLYAAHPELRAQRGQIEPISLSDAASLLPDNRTAILEFLVADDKTYLFVLTRSAGGSAASPELNVHTIDIKVRDLEQETEEFRRRLSLRDLQFRSSALRLFKLLVQPAQSQLSGITNLLVAPDGPLWNLPFQALQPQPGHYLLEDYALCYAPSLTILREMVRLRLRNKNMPAITAGQTLMAMGDPVLATSTSQHAKLTYRDESLSPLPEAAREVKKLQSLYGREQSKVFVGEEATEDRFKAAAGEFRILHLATHGLLNDTNPMYSHLLLSSGGPNAKEDGLLEAWEIMNLDLHADLAVLSACETARGRITSGEGVIGLTWAFFVAGVPTTVVSQWKVESASTSQLMLAFHRTRKIANGQAVYPFHTARALQRAELRLLHDQRYSHPFYWAGFVVVGDPQ